MKKFLKTILYFFIFTTVFYVVSVIIVGELINFTPLKKNLNYNASIGHSFTRLKKAKSIKDIDILFLGASNAYRGFDTRMYEKRNYKVFNLGSSSQTPLQTEILLDRYLENFNPKIIIYAVDPDAFCSDGVESSLDLISNDIIDYKILKLAISQNHLKLLNTLVYATYKRATQRFHIYKQPNTVGKDTYVNNGFVEQNKIEFYKEKRYKEQKWIFNKEQFIAFERIYKNIEKENIELYLVQPPIVNNKYKSFLNNNIFDEKMNLYGSYCNYNLLLHLNDSLFYDENHLNKNGVNVFNKQILELIEKQ